MAASKVDETSFTKVRESIPGSTDYVYFGAPLLGLEPTPVDRLMSVFKPVDACLINLPSTIVGTILYRGDELLACFYSIDVLNVLKTFKGQPDDIIYDAVGSWTKGFFGEVRYSDGKTFPIIVAQSCSLPRLVEPENDTFGLSRVRFVRIAPESPSGVPVKIREPNPKNTIPRLLMNTSRFGPYVTMRGELSAEHEEQRAKFNASDIRTRAVFLISRVVSAFMSGACSTVHIILDDKTSMDIVKSSPVSGFLKAYEKIISPTYKADLLRYWLVHQFGGCYFDDKLVILQSIVSDPFEFLMGCSAPLNHKVTYFGDQNYVEIAFILSAISSRLYLMALEKSISNILAGYMGYHWHWPELDITGNVMISRIIHELCDSKPAILGGWSETSEIGKKLGARHNKLRFPDQVIETSLAVPTQSYVDHPPCAEYGILLRRFLIPYKQWPVGPTHYRALYARGIVYHPSK